ncbi:MAG: type I restriction enzyme HsdR N-terminal domain-containing protein [Muribaculaceae bacterium]|nr:type I restriction enzyme HsdR N-terminal domain-containing protein [Muribaculaceae bacterium]
MQQLNLPVYQFNIKKKGNGFIIFDTLRRRWVTLTPEEWVRQNFVRYLIEEKEFPKELMNNEISITQNGIKRRCDTLVANREGDPLVIIEYKATNITLSQKTFDQIVRYNMVLRARFLIVSNGINHYCCKIDYENNSYAFLNEIPCYNELID